MKKETGQFMSGYTNFSISELEKYSYPIIWNYAESHEGDYSNIVGLYKLFKDHLWMVAWASLESHYGDDSFITAASVILELHKLESSLDRTESDDHDDDDDDVFGV